MRQHYDIIIVGAGAGGGTLAYALRNSGARILVIERGGFLPIELENWDSKAVFQEQRYKTKEKWLDSKGKLFQPSTHYYVGGNTKFYGASLFRLRREDFQTVEHAEGISPAWPIQYEDLAPFYTEAEKIYNVHGNATEDPTEPPHESDYLHPAVPHEPFIAEVAASLKKLGLNPFSIPLGIDLGPQGACVRCATCDGFPCMLHAKADAETACIRPALASGNVELMIQTKVRRLITDKQGKRVTKVEVERMGTVEEIAGDLVVLSAGAVNSAAILLRSANDTHPNGLANASNQVGRNYMQHNNSLIMSIGMKSNKTRFQKTLSINDFYFGDTDWSFPMGNLQLLGKVDANTLKSELPYLSDWFLHKIALHSIDWFAMSEDLPDPENRVIIDSSGRINLHYRPNNLSAHRQLVRKIRQTMREIGFPLTFTKKLGVEANSHQCGTIRFGDDPATSVLNAYCQTYEVPNLFVVDSSFFPSSAAVNPALTIAAQALRVAKYMASKNYLF
jgi:choline dehydrogenase-like flavoprotein